MPFSAIGGGRSRYKTDSHVDADGFSLLLGLGRRTPLDAADLSLGAFLETGWGSYASYNSFDSLPSVKGEGDTSYYGAGLLGRYETPAGPGGAYGEASVRIGRAKTDFHSQDILNSEGGETAYNTSAPYYGAHAGAGYVWNLSGQAGLDFSSKFIWTRQAGDSVNISGDEIRFEDSDSRRLRSGARFSYAVNEYIAPYAGAYCDYEFGGRARATANGDSIVAPSLRGGTGVGELGLTFKPSTTMPVSLDLGLQGYAGKREGLAGSLQAKFEF
jgi:outer membrane autotransporter protein